MSINCKLCNGKGYRRQSGGTFTEPCGCYCPNSRCENGNVSGGPKGDMLCPDCVREGRVSVAPAKFMGRPPFSTDPKNEAGSVDLSYP